MPPPFSVHHPKEVCSFEKENSPAPQKPPRRVNGGLWLYTDFLAVCMALTTALPAATADTVWTKATEIFKDVYNQILLISTIVAIVTASVVLLIMNFSRAGQAVDEARSWLKRIVITWAILNGLGYIMSSVTPFFVSSAASGRHDHNRCTARPGLFAPVLTLGSVFLQTGQRPLRHPFQKNLQKFFTLNLSCPISSKGKFPSGHSSSLKCLVEPFLIQA